MKVNDFINIQNRPPLYEPGTAVMWTEPHIAPLLLKTHLDQNTPLASRPLPVIEKTVAWILEAAGKGVLDILDLGCGPGLYTQRYARLGHRVTGVDFSAGSLAYARERAQEEGLEIDYREQNYVDLDLGEKRFDLITLIYEDFSVLTPDQRDRLLSRVVPLLKKGGRLIMDYPNDKRFAQRETPPSWEAAQEGFWRPVPHLCVSCSFRYEKERVLLVQHGVYDDDRGWEIYRFWNTYYNRDSLDGVMEPFGLTRLEDSDQVLPPSSGWGGDNVTFAVFGIPRSACRVR